MNATNERAEKKMGSSCDGIESLAKRRNKGLVKLLTFIRIATSLLKSVLDISSE